MNWNRIAERDAALRASVDNVSEALAKHRYDNTIGASPPVPFREYARQCGVSEGLVRHYVKAHEVRTTDTHLTISEALVRANASAEQAEVIEAVAEARGTSMRTVQAHHGNEVRRLRSDARERAEKKGTTVKEEATKLAKMQVRKERAAKRLAKATMARPGFRLIELERHLLAARRALADAVALEAELDEEEVEQLVHAIGTVRSLLDLVELKFAGAADVDWDAELARLGEA